MEAENRKVNLDNDIKYWKKSWVAYLRLVIPTVILLIGSMFVMSVLVLLLETVTDMQKDSSIPTGLYLVALIGTIAYVVIGILTIRSYKLFYDDEGIWVYSGIFPWNKGISGIKWRDLDEAVYRTGFISWAAHSYNIRLSHRYTKSSEILLSDMTDGDKAVATINELHIEYLRKKENKK